MKSHWSENLFVEKLLPRIPSPPLLPSFSPLNACILCTVCILCAKFSGSKSRNGSKDFDRSLRSIDSESFVRNIFEFYIMKSAVVLNA